MCVFDGQEARKAQLENHEPEDEEEELDLEKDMQDSGNTHQHYISSVYVCVFSTKFNEVPVKVCCVDSV